MARSRAVRPLEPKRCIACGGVMSDRRHPTLLVVDGGEIVGPFHAGCAERKRLEAQRNPDTNWLTGAASYGHVLSAREETLPW